MAAPVENFSALAINRNKEKVKERTGDITSISALIMKLVIVGDACCGKTALLTVFSQGTFPQLFEPTVFDTYIADVEVGGKRVQLALWDTSGTEDYDRLRPLCYPHSDVILICFAVKSPVSLENVKEKWLVEVLHCCPGVPIILVGCQVDLRQDPQVIEFLQKRNQWPVTTEEGKQAAQSIGAYKYLECSAKTGHGVQEVFQDAAIAALLAQPKGPRRRDTCVVA
ncbi:small GTPase-binding protein [Mycena sanguinolenta]|nr:small GTPase-binding protein [Mycena sanguinolenta]